MVIGHLDYSMQRFYIPSPDIQQKVIEIRDQRILFQANKVLRMKMGSQFSVFNEKGKEVLVEVLEIDRRKIIGNVLEPILRNTESELTVAIYQAIPKKVALFELIVQKATELGVAEIFPLITKRTEKHRLGKFERIQLIAIEAAEQCNRTRIPLIHHPVSFDDVIQKIDAVYLAYENEEGKTLHDFLPAIRKSKKANLFIGPEGGFAALEISLAEKADAKIYSLGPRILRTETAAIASLSQVLI